LRTSSSYGHPYGTSSNFYYAAALSVYRLIQRHLRLFYDQFCNRWMTIEATTTSSTKRGKHLLPTAARTENHLIAALLMPCQYIGWVNAIFGLSPTSSAIDG